MRKQLLASAFVLGAASFAAGSAQASIILDLDSRTAVAGGFNYVYSATLSQDQQLDPKVQANFFTLYDFGPATLVDTTGTLSTDWSFALNSNQSTPAEGVLPNNSAALSDVRATYTGPVLTTNTLGIGHDNLGTFTLFTAFAGAFAIVNNDQDAQLAKFTTGPTNDTPTSNLAAVAVPTIAAAPEPATIALLGGALCALGVLRRKRR